MKRNTTLKSILEWDKNEEAWRIVPADYSDYSSLVDKVNHEAILAALPRGFAREGYGFAGSCSLYFAADWQAQDWREAFRVLYDFAERLTDYPLLDEEEHSRQEDARWLRSQ